MQSLLFMLICIHWFVPLLLAFKIIRKTYYVYTHVRPGLDLFIPLTGLVSCFLFSFFLEFVLSCTVFFLERGCYMPLVLQLLWWIYMVDLSYGASLYYYPLLIITYLYCIASTALIAFEIFDMFSVTSMFLIGNLMGYMFDTIVAIEHNVDSRSRICNIHIPLLYSLYITIIFNTFTVTLRLSSEINL